MSPNLNKGQHSVECPVCSRLVLENNINQHLDSSCTKNVMPVSEMSLNAALSDSRIRVPGSSRPKTTQEAINSLFNVQPKGTDVEPKSSPSASSRQKRPAQFIEHGLPTSRPGKRTKPSKLLSTAPLAERLRPTKWTEFIGQAHLTGPDSLLLGDSKGSVIFWGPPGCGKTTLARLLASQSDAIFKELSATVVGINEVRCVFEESRNQFALSGRRTILFLDEIHRFNKAQQDIFLPFVERGQIQLIGATTENPSFKLTSALLSRCRVFVLDRLTDEDVRAIIMNAIQRVSSSKLKETEDGNTIDRMGYSLEPSSSQTLASSPPHSQQSPDCLVSDFPQISTQIMSSMVSLSAGDARTALSLLELVLNSSKEADESTLLASLRRSVSTSYDRSGDSHYDMISALHKSIRGSKGNAAMYWLARMLSAGEDPMFIARRLVVCASEDIGLADVHALPLAMATLQACQAIGMPECRINLAHLVAYLSEAPKSTRAYEAYNCAEEAAKLDRSAAVPIMMRNAPTTLMKELGYSEGYRYNPQYAHPVHNEYLPTRFREEVFLKAKDNTTGKLWDEESLKKWENDENGGKEWSGRHLRQMDGINELYTNT